MVLERASGEDLMELAAGRGGTVPMHFGALLVLDERGAPDAVALRWEIATRLGRVPRLRQRLVSAPPLCGRPVWVADTDHLPADLIDVRTLESAGLPEHSEESGAQLARLGEFIVEPIPADGPLWRACVLADPAGRARAVMVALHHVVTDGVGGLTVLGALVDDPARAADGGATAQHPAAQHPAAQRPPARELALDAWVARWRCLARWRRGLRGVASGLAELGAGQAGLAGRSSLLAPTGGRRRVEVVETDLGRLASAARSTGATVNDLVLVAISGALRELVRERGEGLDHVVVSVPVSGRRDGHGPSGGLGNAVGVLPVRIPLSPDPAARLGAVVAQRHRLSDRARRGRSAALMAPAVRVLAALGLFQRLITRQRMVHTFETNVRGPDQGLTVCGCRVVRVIPVAVNPGNVTVSFVVLSAGGRLVVSVVSDPDLVPDHTVLCAALERELAALSRNRREEGGPSVRRGDGESG